MPKHTGRRGHRAPGPPSTSNSSRPATDTGNGGTAEMTIRLTGSPELLEQDFLL